jgi:hypothetical protein
MIILGCITKYTPTDIKPYVESIDKSGYGGRKVMLVYDVPTETIEYLKSKGWDLYSGELHQHIILQRFIDSYKLLENYEDETVIWTDVKDVVFQRNPIEWLNTHMGSELMAFSECVHFKDDSWAVVNAGTSYPMEWEWLQHKISYCAGTIVGKGYALKDLFIEIYRWSLTTSNTGQLSDQAAYNVLINLNHFKENVQFVEQEAGFVTQLGTVWVKRNELPITEPTPIYKDGKFYNQNGEEFIIVHQYDRDPKIKQEIINLYK